MIAICPRMAPVGKNLRLAWQSDAPQKHIDAKLLGGYIHNPAMSSRSRSSPSRMTNASARCRDILNHCVSRSTLPTSSPLWIVVLHATLATGGVLRPARATTSRNRWWHLLREDSAHGEERRVARRFDTSMQTKTICRVTPTTMETRKGRRMQKCHRLSKSFAKLQNELPNSLAALASMTSWTIRGRIG